MAAGAAFTGTSSTNNSTGRVLVVKTDASGVTQWEQTYGFSSGVRGNQGFDIIQTSDGGYAVAGDHDLDEGHHGPAKILCMKLDGSGNLLWAKSVGDTTGNDGYAVAESADTLIFLGRQGGVSKGNVQGVVLKVQESTGSILSSFVIRDSTLVPDNSGLYYGLQVFQISVTPNGYHLGDYVSENGDGDNGRYGYVDVGFDGSLLKYARIGLPPGVDPDETINTGAILPLPDGGWLNGETTPIRNNIYWSRYDSLGNQLWARESKLSNTQTQTLGSAVQNANGTFTALGTYSGAALVLQLSSVGAAGCFDTAATISMENPVIEVIPLSQPFTSLATAGSTTALTETAQNNAVTNTTCPSGACYTNYNGPLLCGKSSPILAPVTVDSITTCSDSTFFGVTAGTPLYNTYTDSLTGGFEKGYLATCMQAYKHESFTVTHAHSEYHYTLYYYDQAGNLLKTVPPAGVQINTDTNWIKQVDTARGVEFDPFGDKILFP